MSGSEQPTNDTQGTGGRGADNTRTPRRGALLAAAAVVAVALLAWFALTRDSGSTAPTATSPSATAAPSASASGSASDEPSGSASASGSASPSSTTSAGATSDPSPDESRSIPTRKAVPLDDEAEFGDGVTAELTSIKAIDAEAKGIGEIAGPALKLTIALKNGTDESIPLDYVVVNTLYGKDKLPATAIYGDPDADPFRGTLKPGKSATGVYIFSVPEDERDKVRITVSHESLSPIVVFTGSAPS